MSFLVKYEQIVSTANTASSRPGVFPFSTLVGPPALVGGLWSFPFLSLFLSSFSNRLGLRLQKGWPGVLKAWRSMYKLNKAGLHGRSTGGAVVQLLAMQVP